MIEYGRKKFKSIIKYTFVKLFKKGLFQFECKQRGSSSLQLYVISLGGGGNWIQAELGNWSSVFWANHSFFAKNKSSLLIRSYLVSKLSDLVTVAQSVWAMWANRSNGSPKLSDHEQFAQVAHQKWATWAICSCRSEELSEREQIAQVAHQKWATERIAHFFEKISDWANRSLFWANCSFAYFLAKNERFAQKTNERVPSPEVFVGHTLIQLQGVLPV